MTPNKYQEAIYKEIEEGTGHIQVEAVAGSGKTTTIIQAANLIPEDKKVIFVAFNKHIATELTGKLPENVEARTLHSLGCKAVRDNMGWLKNNKNKTRNILMYKVLDWDNAGQEDKSFFWEWGNGMIQLISLLKGEACNGEQDVLDKYKELAMLHGIDLPLYQDADAYEHILLTTYLDSLKYEAGYKVIDFDDMILYPVINNMILPKYDYVFVDEAQDLNLAQRKLIKLLMHDKTRVIVVGDTYQAIYGFRGADPRSMWEFEREFSPTQLPLSITYRCPRLITEEAQNIVPHIECAEAAEAGTIDVEQDVLLVSKIISPCYVLCRTTAPLVGLCIDLVKAGKNANVLGYAIAEKICKVMEKVEEEATFSKAAFEDYVKGQTSSLLSRGKKYELKSAESLWEIVRAIFASTNPQDLVDFSAHVKRIFSKTATDITLCTIHKAKGLEHDRIYILRPDLLPHPRAQQDWELIQERNLEYVAITRSKKELYYVEGERY